MNNSFEQNIQPTLSYDPLSPWKRIKLILQFKDFGALEVKLRRLILIYIYPVIVPYFRRKARMTQQEKRLDLKRIYQIKTNFITEKVNDENSLNLERQWNLFLRRLGTDRILEVNHDEFIVTDIQSGSCVTLTSDAMIALTTKKPFSKDLRQITKKLKSKNVRLMIALADVFDIAISFNASYLISHCGGICVLQTNIGKEGGAFGLINAVGPVLWTINHANYLESHGRVPWRKRPRLAAMAKTGEVRRIRMMSKVRESLNRQGLDVLQESPQLYADYLSSIKSCRFVVTTCWTQASYIRGSRKTRESRISPTTVTHRVWEGFAAGALVITNPNPTLEAFGFLPYVHFFPLWDEDAPAEEMLLPPDEDMERMADAGHALLTAIVKNCGFPLSTSPRNMGIAS